MADTPAAQRTDDAGPSRRWFLVGGGVLVLAGAATGSVVRVARTDDDAAPAPDPAPQTLLDAAARERALIADLDATTGGDTSVRARLANARADHSAHLAALESVLADYDPPAPSASPSPSTSPAPLTGTARTLAQLRAAETRAGAAAADAAARSSGRVATLLASISASEASHAAVLR